MHEEYTKDACSFHGTGFIFLLKYIRKDGDPVDDHLTRLIRCGMQKDIAEWVCSHFDEKELEEFVKETEEDHSEWMC